MEAAWAALHGVVAAAFNATAEAMRPYANPGEVVGLGPLDFTEHHVMLQMCMTGALMHVYALYVRRAVPPPPHNGRRFHR